MFNRSFWRLVSMASAAGAGWFLVRSLRQQPIALPDKTAEEDLGEAAENVKSAARKTAKRAAAKIEEAVDNGDARRSH